MKKELYIKPATEGKKVMTPILPVMASLKSSQLSIEQADAETSVVVDNPSLLEAEAWGHGNFRHDGFKDDTKIW